MNGSYILAENDFSNLGFMFLSEPKGLADRCCCLSFVVNRIPKKPPEECCST